jgi:hypothetical protein
MQTEKHAIKVDKDIVPTPLTEREEPALTVGADYFVCFGNNIVYPCTLLEL